MKNEKAILISEKIGVNVPKNLNGLLSVTTHDESGKMAGFKSINSSVVDNSYCQKMRKNKDTICYHCYAESMQLRYSNMSNNLKYNYYVLNNIKLAKNDIPVFNDIAVRFHSVGEIETELCFDNFITIAKHNARTHFTLWTKRKDIINSYVKNHGVNSIPNNLELIYSNCKIDNFTTNIPKHFDKIFSVFTAKYAIDNNININCGNKKCIDCMNCYGGKMTNCGLYSENVVNEILKSDIRRFVRSGGMIK